MAVRGDYEGARAQAGNFIFLPLMFAGGGFADDGLRLAGGFADDGIRFLSPSRLGSVGEANRIAQGFGSIDDISFITRELRRKTGAEIVFSSREALRRGRSGVPIGNYFDLDTNTIHLMTGRANTGRGVFFEEVQHALDQFYNPAWNNPFIMQGNVNLHRGTFHRLANNPWFNLSHDELTGFLGWQGGASRDMILESMMFVH
ncbi:hypothetical protein GCM10007047_02940 [Cerasicoccus arenae]|uniref:Uncharacterized protein n=2 Tax=Cerasicoccus arenae TaxID=424488 RepID=A0A8J3DGW2_9BACT|nr:hypothetical protein GCM10007047_02940 [Cerasicoccus arenae]